VLPEFELGDYKNLTFEMPAMDITDEDVTKTLEEMRERAAAFAPVEGRAVQDGDFAQVKLLGTPEGGGDPLQAESVLCHIGAEETMEPFNTNLKGASAGDHKNFDVEYPADYPDPKLAGKKYHYTVEMLGIKTKKLPELNDEFAKDVSDATSLDELKKKVREGLEHQRAHLEQLANEHAARGQAVIDDRDALARSLGAAQQAAQDASSRAGAHADEFETRRVAHETTVRDLQAQLDASVQARESLTADLTSARETLAFAQAQASERSRTDGAALERALRDAEAAAERAGRDRDMMAEELELMRENLAAAQNESTAQLEQLREAAARRIADLEATLQEPDRRKSDQAPVSLAPPSRGGRSPRRDESEVDVRTLQAVAPASAQSSTATPPGSPVRRASRQAFHEEMQVLVDGSPATLIDLSTSGAQVVSQAALKPNRMVRLQLPSEDTPIICKGKVVWARLEAGSTTGLRYRAGVCFTGVDERAVEKFLAASTQKP